MQNVNGNYSNYDKVNVNYTGKADKKDNDKTVQLSKTASEYLQKLKEKYKNVDFIVADFDSDDEAQKYLKQGKGEYNCVITPDMLEKMAADENVAKEYEGIIDDAIGNLSTVKEKLGDDADKVKTFGVSIDNSGKVSYYAIIKDSLKVNENVRAAREKAAEKKAEEKKNAEKEEYEERMVKASTIEELIAIIKGDKDAESNDRIEFGRNDDGAYRIDRVDFGKTENKLYEEFVPTSAPNEHSPFDFKA